MKKLHQANLDEKCLASEIAFEGRLLKVQVDKVELPNGRKSTREIIKHPGAVAILAVTAEQELVLVKQFRYPVDSVLYEVPAGKLDPGEDHLACAKRELSEETGYSASNWEYLTSIVTTPGFTDEVIHLYLATGLQSFAQHTDEDEFIDVMRVPLAEVKRMILEQELFDAKSLAILLLYVIKYCKNTD